jgi:hypothetical protein
MALGLVGFGATPNKPCPFGECSKSKAKSSAKLGLYANILRVCRAIRRVDRQLAHPNHAFPGNGRTCEVTWEVALVVLFGELARRPLFLRIPHLRLVLVLRVSASLNRCPGWWTQRSC